MAEPESIVLEHLRALRAGQERLERKVDRIEAEVLSLRDREQARTIDMNRLERSDLSRDSRLRQIEDRLDAIEAASS